jgi:hypothetical protein
MTDIQFTPERTVFVESSDSESDDGELLPLADYRPLEWTPTRQKRQWQILNDLNVFGRAGETAHKEITPRNIGHHRTPPTPSTLCHMITPLDVVASQLLDDSRGHATCRSAPTSFALDGDDDGNGWESPRQVRRLENTSAEPSNLSVSAISESALSARREHSVRSSVVARLFPETCTSTAVYDHVSPQGAEVRDVDFSTPTRKKHRGSSAQRTPASCTFWEKMIERCSQLSRETRALGSTHSIFLEDNSGSGQDTTLHEAVTALLQ